MSNCVQSALEVALDPVVEGCVTSVLSIANTTSFGIARTVTPIVKNMTRRKTKKMSNGLRDISPWI